MRVARARGAPAPASASRGVLIGPSRTGRRWRAGPPLGRRSRRGEPTVRMYGIAWISSTGTTPTRGSGTPLQARLDHVGEGEEQAGAERRHRPPLAEDQGGEGEISLARRHVADERGVLRDRKIRAREPAERAAHDERAVARGGDGDARGVDGTGVLADRAQAQAEARPVHDPGRARARPPPRHRRGDCGRSPPHRRRDRCPARRRARRRREA